MSAKLLFVVIFTSVFTLTGLVFWIVGLGIGAHRRKLQTECTRTASGEVREILRGADGMLRPLFAYQADGHEILQAAASSGLRTRFYAGQKVTVHYDPSDYCRCLVEEERTTELVARIFRRVGVGLIAVGVLTGSLVWLLA